MGICCCKKEINYEDQPYESSLMFNGIKIIFKRGQINKETADVLVISTDNYINNRSTTIIEEENVIESINTEIKKSRGDNDTPLQNGDVVFSYPGLLSNVQQIAHLAVPIWKGGLSLEEKKISHGFLDILKQSENKKMSSILFTDITSGRFGIPKQIGIKSLIKAIKKFQIQKKTTDYLTTIKFVHKKKSTVVLFENFFKKDLGVLDNSVDSIYTDHLISAYTPDMKSFQIECNNNEDTLSECSQDSNNCKNSNIQ